MNNENGGPCNRDPVTVSLLLRACWFVAIAGLLVFQLVRAGQYGLDIQSVLAGRATAITPALATEHDGASLKVVPVSDASAADTIDLEAKDAVVLMFDTACPYCRQNMPRWLDLIVQLRSLHPEVPVFALSLDSANVDPRQFWQRVDHLVTIVRPVKREEVDLHFETQAIPTTAIVRAGRVTVLHQGAIGQRRRSFLLSALGG